MDRTLLTTNGPRAPWRQPMLNRDPNQDHRQASFLELFFDLCFVVAIAQAAAALHHGITADHATSAMIGYLMVFFAIWWAWMNFTWFVSAYDNDDVPFRLASFVQIIGALIIAAGVSPGLQAGSFDMVYIGYVVMRAGLIYLWLRAAKHNPDRRRTAMRYAGGLLLMMVGWGAMYFGGSWPIWGFIIMALAELAVPYWAERAGRTPWHPGHIVERYGLLLIIVLGESILAATVAVGEGLQEPLQGATLLPAIIIGGILLVFSFWWIYFTWDAAEFLELNNEGFRWAYGHYLIFASVAAVGAGLAANVEGVTTQVAASGRLIGASVTIPTAMFLALIWLLHARPHRPGVLFELLYLSAAILALAATWTDYPVLLSGIISAGTVCTTVLLGHRAYQMPSEAAG